MTDDGRHLLVLGCSDTKLTTQEQLPAIQRYDGPMYRVLRCFLRDSLWPRSLSVAVLSAKYGLIGGLAGIENYDQRMRPGRAAELAQASTATLTRWATSHKNVSLALGQDYLKALDLDRIREGGTKLDIFGGPIGTKLSQIKELLNRFEPSPRSPRPARAERPLYFLPDWDDMLDAGFDFQSDTFSKEKRAERRMAHCSSVMRPAKICDGVLVSLAQHLGSKGVLRKFGPTDVGALAPLSMRKNFELSDEQWVFGDCGAFSYVNEPEPTITTEQALSLYQLHGFDFGASVDHIPLPVIETNIGKTILTNQQQRHRIDLTRKNAKSFLDLHRDRKCSFIPVGTIQGIEPEDYAAELLDYVQMGYKHVAVGGLVPRTDSDIIEIAQAVHKAIKDGRGDVWVHLFGVFRPRIQARLRELGVASFDSATYFRKAWLRSGQNYLSTDGNWYAAIRVPMTSDPRTWARMKDKQRSREEAQILERMALDALHEYGNGQRDLNSTLSLVTGYDSMLARDSEEAEHLRCSYRRTLEARPWESCDCQVCGQLKIDVLIFRGYNRNKRRGSHNTLMLYRAVNQPPAISKPRVE